MRVFDFVKWFNFGELLIVLAALFFVSVFGLFLKNDFDEDKRKLLIGTNPTIYRGAFNECVERISLKNNQIPVVMVQQCQESAKESARCLIAEKNDCV